MTRHIVIVGGGIIGLSVAAECARRGGRVTVIERHGARRDGCSMGNAGMIVPSHFIPLAAPGMVALGLKWMCNPRSPFYIQPRLDRELLAWGWHFWRACSAAQVRRAAPLLRDLNLASRNAYIQAAGGEGAGNDFGLTQKGLLMLCQTAQGFKEETHTAARARELGIPAQVLNPQQAAQLDPGITMDIAGAVHFPMDCHLQPERYNAYLERQISGAGGTVRVDTAVTGWHCAHGRVAAVQTAGGDIAGDEFVLCGGVWSAGLARQLGLHLPLQAGKGYSLTLPNPVESPQICAIFTEARMAITPMGGALRFGGTMEMAGLDDMITARRVEGMLAAIPRYYPRFRPEHFAGIQPWRGLRPCSPDGLPYLGRTRVASNLVIATGHAMMGMSLAPITGQIVAALLAGQTPAFDLSLLSPDRYA